MKIICNLFHGRFHRIKIWWQDGNTTVTCDKCHREFEGKNVGSDTYHARKLYNALKQL